MKASRWLWLVYVPFLALLFWLGYDRFHNKETLAFFAVFLAVCFLMPLAFRWAWQRDRRKRDGQGEVRPTAGISQTGQE